MPPKKASKKKSVTRKAARKTSNLDLKEAYRNLSVPEIYEHSIASGKVQLTASGPFNAITSPHTGRSPNDKFIVQEASSEGDVHWGSVNRPIDEHVFDRLHQKVIDYLNKRPALYARDVYACADPAYRLRVRFVTESAWHTLFIHNMFIRPTQDELARFEPDFTVLHAPEMQADPKKDGTHSGTFILLHLGKRIVLIGGTRYAGELKKSIFTALNYLLPKQGVLSMHCSANVGEDRRT
ncbi:MAG: phosphoenolpyruvate carboxykinase (ATP), partial [Anaerolineales bacterium]